MLKLLFISAVSVALISNLAQAVYYKVEKEGCNLMTNSSTPFNELLSCPSYSMSDVDQKCLSKEEEAVAVKTVPDWTLVKNSELGDQLKRSFVFDDFQQAFYFMSSCAQLAEKNQHHPDWHNLWNTVDVILTTDDQRCLGTFDVEFAQAMDYLYNVQTKKEKK
jgi:4a-hydroxytetrahydrobiopterin dehydratase